MGNSSWSSRLPDTSYLALGRCDWQSATIPGTHADSRSLYLAEHGARRVAQRSRLAPRLQLRAGEGACSNEQDQAYASNQDQLSTNTSYAGKGCRGSEGLRALFLYMPCLAMMRAADMDKVGMRKIALPIIQPAALHHTHAWLSCICEAKREEQRHIWTTSTTRWCGWADGRSTMGQQPVIPSTLLSLRVRLLQDCTILIGRGGDRWQLACLFV